MKNKALIESGAKTLFSLVPFGSQLLSEVFFDYRSRVKQDRLNSFIEGIIDYLKRNDIEAISTEIQESEDFGDLFESVIRRVIQTNSAERICRFRSVVTDYIANPVKIDYRDTYLDIIERINGTQIKILKAHVQIENDIRLLLRQRDGLREEMLKLNNKLETLGDLNGDTIGDHFDITSSITSTDHQLKNVEKEIELDSILRKPAYYGVESGDYLFLIQDLYGKGLMVDEGIGALDTKPFDKMAITDFGKGFLKFINETELSSHGYPS
ncbi:hypothetical protein [Mucilaginibacter ginsenosidivorax]|uniref:Uncharacterized protein n=1 Tax=Mucilaginibacter ginsenosidivorax TaxID=862126 RepID=A0A5B8W3X7_9SPHI|nr:hypothetical protein [Mucilaginibacter ginsenosidivorax]QEC78433.1 hypothetical protein FSB76_21715 [Mucilaginibacter ginsenosidivorax]